MSWTSKKEMAGFVGRFRCECLRLAELPYVTPGTLEGLLSALAPPHRAVLVRLLALFRPMATAPSCSQTVRRRRPPCFRFRA